jgi:hypothetical protein
LFLTSQKFVHLSEIDETTVNPARIRLKVKRDKFDQINFSAIKLFIAIARAAISSDVFNRDLLFEVAAQFLRFQPIINTKNRNLKLNTKYTSTLRDFSLTSRIGELGQGLSYIFAQDYLKYLFVGDFLGFLAKHGKSTIVKSQSTPDFVLSNQSNFNLALLESKSGWKSNKASKSDLRYGLSQCLNGKNIIQNNLTSFVVNKIYCTSSNFVDASDIEESVLNYVDPTLEDSNTESTLDFARFHYASWFSLIGDFSNTTHLYKNTPLSRNIQYETRSFNGEDFFVQRRWFDLFPFPFISLPQIGFHYIPIPTQISLGISVATWKVLSEESNSKEFKLYEAVSDDKVELFIDGTIIFYEGIL